MKSQATGDQVVLVNQTFECSSYKQPVDFDLVKVTINAPTGRVDAIHTGPRCTGRIGRIEVDTWNADGVKIHPGTHDLVIEGGVDTGLVTSVIVDYREVIDDTPTFGPWQSQEFPAGATSFVVTGLKPDTRYQVRIRYRTVRGVEDPDNGTDLGEQTTGGVDASTVGGVLATEIADAVEAATTALADLNTAIEQGRKLAETQIKRLRVKTASADSPIRTLSGGNAQKVVIAKWLARNPRVVVLDEPTRGIDVGARAGIYDIIVGLAKDGVAVIVVSSDLEEVLGVSNRILVLAQGKQAGILNRDEANDVSVMELATI